MSTRNGWERAPDAGSRRRQRWVIRVTRAGTLVSAVMFAGNAVAALPISDAVSGLVITPSAGDSDTEISMQILPAEFRCPGADARWSAFLVDATLDPDLLRYDDAGPLAGSTAHPVLALRGYADGTPLALRATAPDGSLGEIPTVGFRTLGPGALPDGRYRVGIACARRDASSDQYVASRSSWLEMTVSSDQLGGPAEFRWRVGGEQRSSRPGVSPTVFDPPMAPTAVAPRTEAGEAPTSTIGVRGPGPGVVQEIFVVVPGPTTTTTTTSPTTTTTASPTTTIVASAAATTTLVGVGGPVPTTIVVSTTVAPATPRSGSVSTGGGSSGSTNRFPRTGSDVRRVLLWGVALMSFGRAAVVSSRVQPPRSRRRRWPRLSGLTARRTRDDERATTR